MNQTTGTENAQAVSSLSAERDSQALARALGVLDQLLGVAVEKQERLLGPASLLDPWRGMHLDQADVQRLLTQQAPTSPVSYDAADLLGEAARQVDDARLHRQPAGSQC